jgi:uncharacterized protein
VITGAQMKKIEEFARKKYENFSGVHNMRGHINLVLRNAEILAKKEGGDLRICKAAILLHDVGYVYSDREHAKYSARMAGAFLRNLGMDKGTVERIITCIKYHGWKFKKERTTLEAKIVGDADRMEVFGPWGLGRVFEDDLTKRKFGINETLARAEEFTEKAFRSMHTKTGKKLARPLYEYSREFFRLLKRQRGF